MMKDGNKKTGDQKMSVVVNCNEDFKFWVPLKEDDKGGLFIEKEDVGEGKKGR